MAKRSRGWTITLNNYTEEEYIQITTIAQLHSKFWIFGKEVGNSGTPHIQGYIYFEFAKAFTAVVKLFGNKRIHWEVAKGTKNQNYDYCSKDGAFETNIEKKKPGCRPQVDIVILPPDNWIDPGCAKKRDLCDQHIEYGCCEGYESD